MTTPFNRAGRWRSTIGIFVLFAAFLFATGNAFCAPPNGFTTAEVYKMEATALLYASVLLEKGIWKEDGAAMKVFNKYKADDTVKIADWDDKNRTFLDT